MAALSISTSIVSPDWYRTQGGYDILSTVMHRGTHQRKPFGLLEHPSLPPELSPDEFEYKIFVSGRSGVGKMSIIAKLSGHDIPPSHIETPGVQTSVVYWPALMRDMDKVVMFKLHFWDAGETALKKFSHILPACKDKADGVIFMFSYVDKSSFEDLPQQMSRVLDPQDNLCKFVMGTKLELHTETEISQRDVEEFETHWKLPVLHIQTGPSHSASSQQSDVRSVAPVLNYICEQLWKRDRQLAGQYQNESNVVYSS